MAAVRRGPNDYPPGKAGEAMKKHGIPANFVLGSESPDVARRDEQAMIAAGIPLDVIHKARKEAGFIPETGRIAPDWLDQVGKYAPYVIGGVGGGVALAGLGGAGAAGGAAGGAGGGAGAAGVGTTLAAGAAGPSIWDRIASIAGPAANIASAASQGRAEGRANEAENARREDELAMRQAEFARDTPRTRTVQTAMGDLLANMQDVSIDVPGVANSSVRGGLRPSALGPNARQAGAALSQQALQALLTGSDIPTPNERPAPSWIDSVLNIGSAVGTGIGAVNAFRPRTNVPTPAPNTQPTPQDPFSVNRRGLAPVRF